MEADFWEHAAQRDPLWAVLSDPSKRGRLWDLRAFFETGTREISLLLYQLRRLGRFPQTGRALDFGCGVGRLTQPLAATFSEAVGVDASPTMIELAQRLSFQPAARYVLNQSPMLEQFATGSFDFVYSDIVLQHLEPDAAERYAGEFLRVLKPGAVAVFQLPSHQRTPAERPPSPVRMPTEAYQSRLTLVGGLPAELAPLETAMVTVEVQNTGPMAWDQHVVGAIRVGNHWRDKGGSMLIQDDGRTRLPEILASGASLGLPLAIQAPPEPGMFLCEFDVVHEGISWFGDVAALPTLRMPVAVSLMDGAPRRDSGGAQRQRPAVTIPEFPDIYSALEADDTSDIPPFPMHGIPRAQVVDGMRRHAGDIFFVEEDERGGPEWLGYRYFVEKRG